MREPRFDRIAYPASWPLAVCRACACVIVDDDEGANRAEHAAFHADIGLLTEHALEGDQ